MMFNFLYISWLYYFFLKKSSDCVVKKTFISLFLFEYRGFKVLINLFKNQSCFFY